jgi:hypothetical protein
MVDAKATSETIRDETHQLVLMISTHRRISVELLDSLSAKILNDNKSTPQSILWRLLILEKSSM